MNAVRVHRRPESPRRYARRSSAARSRTAAVASPGGAAGEGGCASLTNRQASISSRLTAVAQAAARTAAMPDRWLPTDPRQREIHRLLQQLVGGEPAAFFLDACRLMDGDYRLEATTHVVGHLLRELDLVLRAVLRPIVSADLWPPRDT